jgi:tetraacyldisaccharide 4'-kinase
MSLIERIWWRERPPAWEEALLAPLLLPEALFRAAVAARGVLYARGLLRSARPPVPVLSVGNVAVGGAGKTPAALAIAERLLARGRRVAILSRGYGAVRRDPRIVSDGRSMLLGAAEGGDEPVLLARRLPRAAVLCGPHRAALARVAVEQLAADALLLDDGFQHRALARDLDVVVLDAANPAGNGHLLPRGPNREPLAAVRRSRLAWLSRVDQAAPAALEVLREQVRRLTGRTPVESRHAPVDVVDGALVRSLGAGALRGKKVAIVCGIARPGSFRRTVEALGAEIAGEHLFPDHHRFAAEDVAAALLQVHGRRCDLVVTTEKDAVRLPSALAADARVCAVRIRAEIVRGEEELEAEIGAALAAWPTASATATSGATSTSTSTSTASPARRGAIP